MLVVRVVQANLLVALLGPGSGAIEGTADTGWWGSVEILGVAHSVAVGILVVQVSAGSGVQRLIVVDRVLHRARRPFGEGLVYVF